VRPGLTMAGDPLAALAKHRIRTAKMMGDGAFSEVYKGSLTTSAGKTVECAVKVYSNKFTQLTPAQIFEIARIETGLIGRLRHKNIISLYSFTACDGVVASCLELANSDLLDAIVPEKGVPADQGAAVLGDIARGLSYLHSEAKLVHLDLKAENVLLVGKLKHGQIAKLADFDAALPVGFKVEQPRGTASVHPPDLLVDPTAPGPAKEVQPPADVWALGLLAYALIKGKHAWGKAELSDAQYASFSRSGQFPAKDKMSAGLSTFFSKIFSLDPANRPTTDEIAAKMDENWADEVDHMRGVRRSPSRSTAGVIARMIKSATRKGVRTR